MNRKVGISSLAIGCVLVTLLALLFGIPYKNQGAAQAATHLLRSERGDKAVEWVASAASIPASQLSVVDEFRIALPLTGRVLDRQFVLDVEGQGQLLYEVTLDESGELLLQDGTEDRLWDTEGHAYQTLYEETVIQLIAQQQDVPTQQLRFVNGVMYSYLFTGQSYWLAQVMDDKTALAYDIAIDAQGKPVDVKALQQAEFEAQKARYGRLDRELYYLLQFKEASDVVPVLLWLQGVDYDGIDRELGRRYPELEALRVVEGRVTDAKGVPVRLDDALRQRVEADYSALLK
jgi:hypothetical protein